MLNRGVRGEAEAVCDPASSIEFWKEWQEKSSANKQNQIYFVTETSPKIPAPLVLSAHYFGYRSKDKDG
jgi:hypothetical protein